MEYAFMEQALLDITNTHEQLHENSLPSLLLSYRVISPITICYKKKIYLFCIHSKYGFFELRFHHSNTSFGMMLPL